MSVAALRDKVTAKAGAAAMTPALLCITGASGAGKTTVITTLREQIASAVLPTLCFDSLGVPSEAEMQAGWESGRGWQKAMTWHWVYTARNVFRTHPLVVLEGSFDPQYAVAACSHHRVRGLVVLLHADEGVRTARLARRGQPELATPDMTTWASYLHESTQQLGGVVVDASKPIDEVLAAVCQHAVALMDQPQDPGPGRLRSPTGPRGAN